MSSGVKIKMENRKGQGLSLQVIIIAILVLIVLVVLVLIFTGKIGGFGESTEETSNTFSLDNCEIPGTGRYCTSDAQPAGTAVPDAKCPDFGDRCFQK